MVSCVERSSQGRKRILDLKRCVYEGLICDSDPIL